MRKVVILVGVAGIPLHLAVGACGARITPNGYRGTIRARLEQHLNRKIELGNMNLGLFPPSFRVTYLSISDDPRFNSSRPFIQSEGLSVSVKLLPLLSKSAQIASLARE